MLSMVLCLLLAFLKQQVKVVKGTTKSTIVNEEIPHLLEGGGKMEVSCVGVLGGGVFELMLFFLK